MRDLKFRAWFNITDKYSIILSDVSLHQGAKMVGLDEDTFKDHLEGTSWKIYDGDKIQHKETEEIVEFNKCGILDSGEDYFFFKNAKVMQFTGFKDKDGDDIYENDLIKDDYGHLWDVRFENGCFWLHRDGHGGMNQANSWPKDCYPMFRVNHELYSKKVGYNFNY